MEKKLLEVFRKVFSEVNPDEITLDSEFREWDQYSSLTQVELIDAITTDLGVKIMLRPFIKAETIGDVLDIIKEQ